jgi:hypothetical protein
MCLVDTVSPALAKPAIVHKALLVLLAEEFSVEHKWLEQEESSSGAAL